MTTYKYKGQSLSGARVSGVVRAYDEFEAVAKLRDTCAFITKIEPVKERGNALDKPIGFRLKDKELALLCSQFSIILTSGLSVMRCVEMVASQTRNKYTRRMLEKVDEETARRLHPNDLRRVVRALEIYELTGTPMSRQKRQEPERPYDLLPMALRMPRPELQTRIAQRVQEMMRQGLLREVQGLLDSGVPAESQSMQAIGYKELVPVCRGQVAEADAVWQIILNTRHYAKRQETWFRAEEAIRWVDAGPSALDGLRRMTDDFLMN